MQNIRWTNPVPRKATYPSGTLELVNMLFLQITFSKCICSYRPICFSILNNPSLTMA